MLIGKGWAQLELSGEEPPARRGHSATLISASHLLLFGGISTLGISNLLTIIDLGIADRLSHLQARNPQLESVRNREPKER
jgi:hypothetical protein